jgi:glycosyltransferase involved in cell wall biosynthesis
VLAKSVFYRFADRITAVSEGVRTDMTKWLWLRPGAITIVYNPVVDGQLLQSKEEKVGHPWFDPQRDIPVIVHAGRFVFQKDHVTLIDAFANLHVSTKARLFLLGDGPLKPMIQERVQHLGLSEYVEFAGFDLNPYKYFSRCDVFVLSSRHEGMPGVLIQAMACGAPAVSTDCPYGPSEIISKPGTDGLLVTVGNPKELARAIESLLQNNDMRLRIAHAGVQAVRKFHLAEALETYLKAVQW